MPSDIRSFFSGASQANGSQKTTSKKADDEPTKPKSTKTSRKKATVIEDSDDDLVLIEKMPPKRTTPRKQPKAAEPKVTATTASDYFATNNKPKKSAVVKTAGAKNGSAASVATSTKASKAKPAVNGKKGVKSHSKFKTEDDDFEDLDNDDNIFAADYKKGKSRGDDYDDGSDAEDTPLPHRGSRSRGKQTKTVEEEEDYVPQDNDNDIDMKDGDANDTFAIPDDDDEFDDDKPKKRASNSKKRKSEELDDDDEPTPKKGKSRAKSTTAKPKTPNAKKEVVEDSAELKSIFADIPLVRAPTPPPKDKDNKFNYHDHMANRAAPAGANSKELPTGAENCLAGLTFVFTGVLESLEREVGQALVKQYGGKVVGAPSGKTSYVILGSDAGPSKLQKIRNWNLKTINEDGLFELIRRLPANGGDGKAAAAAGEKKRKEEAETRKRAQEMEEQAVAERAAEQARIKQLEKSNIAKGKAALAPRQAVIPESSKLWTVKYSPTSVQQVVGNKAQVEKLAKWLRAFPKSLKTNFKLGGADGSGTYRAVIIHGPPGIGKTTAAHLVAKLEGYDIVENNASDTRSKKLMEESLKGVLSTTSLLGYFAGDGKRVEESKKKLVLIMDEVDGMSAGDRGGVGALAAVCKKTRVPIILICNDRKLPKMKPFDFVTYDLPFRRPTTDMIRSRIMTILYREQLNIPLNVVNALIEGTNADIRQVVNMISTAKLNEEELNFQSGKDMSKAWQKHVILKPWDITSRILGGGMFSANSSSSLSDKVELYFNDHEMAYLMLQENYLGTQPILANSYEGHEKRLKQLELVDKAAQSISDGDLVDRLIHGSQQQWSLMPTHAVFSFVRPASFISGSQAGSQTRFTSWLGNNSKLGKLNRMVKEIQGHMRLRSSGDRHEVRQQYIPTLWNMMPKRLEVEGKEAVQPVIDLMDSYFLAKDDLDAISELGVGPMDMEKYLKIEPQVKSTFTRLYNQQSHPLPFMKASSVLAPKKSKKDAPDLEEAIEESDDGEPDDESPDKEDEGDLSKDKYIKAPKKKAAPKANAAAKGKGKKRAVDSDAEESEAKKTKPRAKARAKK